MYNYTNIKHYVLAAVELALLTKALLGKHRGFIILKYDGPMALKNAYMKPHV